MAFAGWLSFVRAGCDFSQTGRLSVTVEFYWRSKSAIRLRWEPQTLTLLQPLSFAVTAVLTVVAPASSRSRKTNKQ